MSIITLTTDWGIKDFYLAALKGTILNQIPEATIVDVSHEINPFDLNEASYILRNTWENFPEGTIHLIGISSEASPDHPHLLIKEKGQYFIGADNGLFCLLFDETPTEIYELDVIQSSDKFTFSTKDVFVNVAKHVLENKDLNKLGEKIPDLIKRTAFQPVVDPGVIKGKIIYIDHYQNVVTNISEKLFKEVCRKHKFQILVNAGQYRITKIHTSYSDVGEGELVALFGTDNLLEIAQNRGRAAGLLGLELDDVVRIEVEE